MDIIFFMEVCNEFVEKMCAPYVLEYEDQSDDDDDINKIVDMEHGIDFDEELSYGYCGYLLIRYLKNQQQQQRIKID